MLSTYLKNNKTCLQPCPVAFHGHKVPRMKVLRNSTSKSLLTLKEADSKAFLPWSCIPQGWAESRAREKGCLTLLLPSFPVSSLHRGFWGPEHSPATLVPCAFVWGGPDIIFLLDNRTAFFLFLSSSWGHCSSYLLKVHPMVSNSLFGFCRLRGILLPLKCGSHVFWFCSMLVCITIGRLINNYKPGKEKWALYLSLPLCFVTEFY